MWKLIALLVVILLVVWALSQKKEGLAQPSYIRYGNDMVTNDQLIKYAQQGN